VACLKSQGTLSVEIDVKAKSNSLPEEIEVHHKHVVWLGYDVNSMKKEVLLLEKHRPTRDEVVSYGKTFMRLVKSMQNMDKIYKMIVPRENTNQYSALDWKLFFNEFEGWALPPRAYLQSPTVPLRSRKVGESLSQVLTALLSLQVRGAQEAEVKKESAEQFLDKSSFISIALV
jgi:hypothetical protein